MDHLVFLATVDMTFEWAILVIFGLFILLALWFTGAALRVLRKNDLKATSTFFARFFLGFLALMFAGIVLIGVLLVVTYLHMGGSVPFLAVVTGLKTIFEAVFYVLVFRWMKILLGHLEKEEIFLAENALSVRKSGKAFLYLALIEIVGGIVTGIVVFFTGMSGVSEFSLSLNLTVILYLVIGFLLLLVGHLLDKAIAVYEENRLTI